VQVHASMTALGAILEQPGEGNLHHPVYFASRKISQAEHNYTTTEREGLAMVYSLQNFRHYLLGSHFKFLIYHSSLKYVVKKPVLEGCICRWFLLFQEFSFEVVVKPGKLNVGPDHLRQEWGESGEVVDDQFPYTNIFHIEFILDYLSNISLFLKTSTMPEGYYVAHKRHLMVHAVYYQLIVGQLYKLGLYNILRHCVLYHERPDILWKWHSGVTEVHVGRKKTIRNILQEGLWWPTLFKYDKEYDLACDVCQGVGNPSHCDELPLQIIRALQAFEKWVVDFIGLINPPAKHSKERYIIIVIDYLTRLVEAEDIQDFSTATATRFIF
jgi:hypothetical protein